MSLTTTITMLSVGILTTFAVPARAAAQDLRSSITSVALRSAAQQLPLAPDRLPHRPPLASWSSPKSPRQSSAATKASIVALGALGGFFAGGFGGAALENAIAPCRCDDPGLKGSLIGAPAGAVAGGMLAFHFTR